MYPADSPADPNQAGLPWMSLPKIIWIKSTSTRSVMPRQNDPLGDLFWLLDDCPAVFKKKKNFALNLSYVRYRELNHFVSPLVWSSLQEEQSIQSI